MKGLREKFRKNEGFTLVEMLIVVAIIAILIAISVPMVNSSLEEARKAVDRSNARSAISLATIEVLTKNINKDTTWGYSVNGTSGSLTEGADGDNGKSKDYASEGLQVTYKADTQTFTTTYDALLKNADASPAP